VIRVTAFALALAAPTLSAAADPAALLAEAAARLDAAESEADRLAALAAATAAQEAAMQALRASLRAMPERRATIAASLEPLDAASFSVMGALDRVVRAPRGVLLAHPAGPLAAVRAASVAGGMQAALARRAGALQEALAALAGLEVRRREALDLLAGALEDFAAARAEIVTLGAAGVAPAFTAAVDSLPALLAALDAVPRDPMAETAQSAALAAARGRLPLPVRGDARPEGFGLVIEAAPWILVRSPVRATVRFAGPLPPLGGVVVLEPAPDAAIVLQGLGQTAAAPGAVVEAGQPVGHLGGPVPSADEFVMAAGGDDTAPSPQSLYMELWRSGRREDAAGWFALDPPEPARLQ
jgi:septal ring factor EnvC (AmiA/AmiB activator)